MAEPERKRRERALTGVTRLIFAVLLLFSGPLLAQQSDAVVVLVDVGTSGLDADAIRREIASELRVTVSSTPVKGARGTLDVRVDAKNVSITYETREGQKLVRSVARPKDPSQELEVIALLAGNLARDEARELLGELGPKEAPPAGTESGEPPPSTPSPPEEKKPPAPAAKPAAPKPEPKSETPRTARPVPKQAFANLSLFHPIALYPDSHRREINFELGLAYSRLGALTGVGIDVGAIRVDGKAKGLTLAAIWTSTRGGADGAFGTGLFSTSAGRLRGAEGSGIFNHREGAVRGFQGAGIFNRAQSVEGFQGAGILNLAEDVDGVQAAGIFNQATGKVRGVQGGLVNVDKNVSGVVFGLVTVADEVDGLSLSPISILSKNRTRAVLFTDSVAIANIGVKYDTGRMYSLFTLGADPAPKDDQRWGGGGAVGVHVLPDGKPFLDLDIMYRYFDTDPADTHVAEHSTVLRGIVGWDFGVVGLFLGLGGEHRVTTVNEHRGRGYGVLGIQLF
jgi:hypothetical protein